VATRVALDALGGDHAPEEIVAGALEAASDQIAPVLFGPPELASAGLELVPCSEEIAMNDKPADAVRAKPDSSLVRAVRAVGDGEAAAAVSAGNTGAVLAASLLHVRRLPGVHRPGIAIVLPGRKGPTVLIDAGANADARPEHLVQFGHMGAVFAEEMLGVREPSVRLFSIGEEAEKGNQLTLEAHGLLAGSDLNFLGNVESRELLEGAADVVVTDGFTGNVSLKLMEGTARTVTGAIRAAARSNPAAAAGGLLMRPALGGLRRELHPDTTGGAILLGLRQIAVVGHGSAGAEGIANSIRLAAHAVEVDAVERTAELIREGGVGRGVIGKER
jgi:glycerol-3-phosphate acyltransferase PlsX